MGLLQEGQIIRGTYDVELLLGEGAFAEVYRVKHRFLGRQAMKVFKLIGMTVEETEKMLDEPIMLSRIGHPNIVRVFDANVTETSRGVCGFFTMEYVAGGNLEKFWRSHGARFVPVETSVEVMRQVCRGLAVAHGETPPIVHRDIKPQNILVGYDATGLNARVSDFGLAKRVNPLTLMASARGTRVFKSPEALSDWQSDSCAGDVWALGMTLYLLLTDRLPFSDQADFDDVDMTRFEKPLIPPSRLNVEVNAALDEIVFRALAMDPSARYPSAKDLLADLMRWRPKPLQPTGKDRDGGRPSDVSKSALGMHSPIDAQTGRRMATDAVRLAREKGRLAEAADLMEEAFNKWPDLRDEYEYQVRVWRRGIAM
ncbi:MAG: serine/threonine protein kinase [Acidobacteria bacterium]|nr:serine/threonine protein kinase [Acidobacteriota bacterium]